MNDAPVANDVSVATNEDTPVEIAMSGSDIEGDALTFTVTSDPSNGSYDGSTYTPNDNFNGSDSFTYTANDGSADSDAAIVSITINAVNDAPVANNISVTTDEDTSVDIILAGSDVENDALTFDVVDAPSNGSYADGAYTPDENYNGSDSFTYRAFEGQ